MAAFLPTKFLLAESETLMSLETADTFARVAMYSFLIGWCAAGLLRARVARLDIRRSFTNLAIVFLVGLVTTELVRSTILLMKEDYLGAGMWVVIIAYQIYVSRSLFDDDNWFNDQFKKLKRGVKKLGSRLGRIRIAFPSPLPTPA